MSKNEKMDIVAIKTKDKFYFSIKSGKSGYSKHLFNGKHPELSFHSNWYVLDKELQSVSKLVPGKAINYRYKLIDESFKSEKVPLEISREDACYYDGDEYDWIWRDKYEHLESLYKLEWDMTPETKEEIDFTCEVVLELDDLSEPSTFRYNSDLAYKILCPPIILHERPCSITSSEMYSIVRNHIKSNIDNSVAKITSDYDFCFKVEKIIDLTTPHVYTVNTNAMYPRRKPKYEKRQKDHKLIQCFEMTHDRDKYKGYTVINGVSGNSQKDLEEKVKHYCENVMEKINEPLKECPHCAGTGIINSESVKVKT